MNAKKCKALRRVARKLAEQHDVPSRAYVAVAHRVWAWVLEKDEKTGLFKGPPVYKQVTRHTVMNSPQSERGIYRNLKKMGYVPQEAAVA